MDLIPMKIKFIEQWRFRLAGRSVPVLKAEDITNEGLIYTLHLVGDVKKRANSLINTWDAKGWEIQKDSEQITIIDEKGIGKICYVVSDAGRTINLYTKPWQYPNHEDTIGRAAMMDDITDSMDLNKSMRNMVIGLIFGIGLGSFIIGPIITGMLS
jgi:hypothetical protein